MVAGFELSDFLRRTKNIKRRLIDEVPAEELYRVERDYKCCGIHSPHEYAIYPNSCCGETLGISLCPYAHGCFLPYYYWETLYETWRLIGDCLKIVFFIVLTFCCFSRSIRSKEDRENLDDTNRSTIDEEDLWLTEERKDRTQSEKDHSESPYAMSDSRATRVRLFKLGDLSTNKEDVDEFESCNSECKSDSKVCSIQNPEGCKENTETDIRKTTISNENIANNEVSETIFSSEENIINVEHATEQSLSSLEENVVDVEHATEQTISAEENIVDVEHGTEQAADEKDKNEQNHKI